MVHLSIIVVSYNKKINLIIENSKEYLFWYRQQEVSSVFNMVPSQYTQLTHVT